MKYTVITKYRNSTIETAAFDSLEDAERTAREECKWEFTTSATVKRGAEVLLELDGDFRSFQ